ncbi:hypothetical protein OBE_08886, partial [human gut metagenome]
ARYDGASNLGTNNKWGFFPGVSLGWHVDKEKFWSFMPENLMRLKLRASYGVNGNISGLGDYTAQGSYSVGSKYLGNAGITMGTMANQDLSHPGQRQAQGRRHCPRRQRPGHRDGRRHGAGQGEKGHRGHDRGQDHPGEGQADEPHRQAREIIFVFIKNVGKWLDKAEGTQYNAIVKVMSNGS